MPDLDPNTQRLLEARLRTELSAAADDAPSYRDLAQRPAPTPSHRPAARARGVTLAAAACVAVLVGGAVTWFALQVGTDDSPGAAQCASRLRFDGREYVDVSDLALNPRAGGTVGRGVLAGCDDGNGAAPERNVPVAAVAGLEPTEAVYADDVVWVPADAPVPSLLTQARQAPGCSLDGPTDVAGLWQAATPTRKVRFDGDLRPPYTIDLLVEDRAVVPAGYRSAHLQVAVTKDSDAPRPREVVRMLQRGAPAEVTLRCSGPRFIADSLKPADNS
jgi:hypothetical protein